MKKLFFVGSLLINALVFAQMGSHDFDSGYVEGYKSVAGVVPNTIPASNTWTDNSFGNAWLVSTNGNRDKISQSTSYREYGNGFGEGYEKGKKEAKNYIATYDKNSEDKNCKKNKKTKAKKQ